MLVRPKARVILLREATLRVRAASTRHSSSRNVTFLRKPRIPAPFSKVTPTPTFAQSKTEIFLERETGHTYLEKFLRDLFRVSHPWSVAASETLRYLPHPLLLISLRTFHPVKRNINLGKYRIVRWSIYTIPEPSLEKIDKVKTNK